METTSSPFSLDLQFRGFIEGLIIKGKSSGQELCYYFGGIPYALPPVGTFRWRKPRPLEPCYRYGTRANPGRYTGSASVCPQPGRQNELFDEDCLQCNIWIPTGPAPANGWPVYFYIHGGFIQTGNANTPGNPTALLSETPFKAIIVKPAYRLNVFGFLASQELLSDPDNKSKTVGNLGFWDLRLALEWSYKNINYFGGDPSNITIGGYSAGAHCAFYQLAYDLDHAPEKRIIKRIIMHSNGPGVQPKSLFETQRQFDELLSVLKVPSSLSPKEKLSQLRAISSKDLIIAISKMRIHQFRAVTDGVFIKPTLFAAIKNGSFARKMTESNIGLLIGDCKSEHHIYARHRPPPQPTPLSLYHRFLADYPKAVCATLGNHYTPTRELPRGSKSWKEAFGKIYADIQIHATQRGFINTLHKHGAGSLVHRYRIEWRSGTVSTPKKFGATHGADMTIWWWGDGKVLPKGEKKIIKEGFGDMLAKFVKGEELTGWGDLRPDEARRLKEDGSVDIWRDDEWDEGLNIWKAVVEASTDGGKEEEKSRL